VLPLDAADGKEGHCSKKTSPIFFFLHRLITWKKNKFFRRNRFDSAVFTP